MLGGAVQGDLQSIRLLAVFAVLLLGFCQLCRNQLCFLLLRVIDGLQTLAAVAQRLHAALLSLEGALAGIHGGIKHCQTSVDVRQSRLIFFVAQYADPCPDSLIRHGVHLPACSASFWVHGAPRREKLCASFDSFQQLLPSTLQVAGCCSNAVQL